MFKKSRVTDLKHRNTKKKQKTRRVLARQLIKGDITVDQLGRLAGEATTGVLRTVNYLSETEGITLANTLSEAVAQAVTPASSSSSAILARRAAAVAAASRPAPVVKEPAVEVEEQLENEPVTDITIAEEPMTEPSSAVAEAGSEIAPSETVEPPPLKKRTRASTKSVEQPETAPAPKPQTRASTKVTTSAKEELPKVAPKKRTRASTKSVEQPETAPAPKPQTRASTKAIASAKEELPKVAPQKRARAAPKAVEAPNDTDKATPKKRTRAPAKPKE